MLSLKATHFIPPVIALVIASSWAGYERQSLARVTIANEALEKAISVAKEGSGEEGAAGLPTGKDGKVAAKAKEKIVWKKMAEELLEMQRGGGMGDMRKMIRLQQQLQEMSREEWVAALDEIDALGLSVDEAAALERMLLEPLIEKDPELALTRNLATLKGEQDGNSWQLSEALRKWAVKDQDAATAWFDSQIAAGTFDSKSLDGNNRVRMQFEGRLIATMLATDADAASSRLAGLPTDQRAAAAEQIFQGSQLKQKEHAAYAKMIREQIPVEKQASLLSRPVFRMVNQEEGLSKVADYLSRIDANPAERAVSVEEAATTKIRSGEEKPVTRADIDGIRKWAGEQAPEAAEAVTGKTLAAAAGDKDRMSYAAAADMAVEYRGASGSDEVLIGFLEREPPDGNKSKALELAGKIQDPKIRERFEQRFK